MKISNSQPAPGSLQTNLQHSILNINQSLLNHNPPESNHNQSLPNPFKSPLNHHRSPSKTSFTFLILLAIPFLPVFLPSCEKAIDVDLNETEPAVVIEGNLLFGEGDLEVKVSETSSYFSNEPVPKVENAAVFLDNGPGFQLQAEQTEPGIYKLYNLPANTYSAYRLTVKIDEQVYTGVSSLAPLVKIDSLNYEYQQAQVFFDAGYRILLYFSDSPDVENYYRVKLYRNRERYDEVDDLIVFDDSSLDGKNIRVRLRGQLFEPGDTVRVELLSIDKNAWEFFSSLREIANLNPGSPSPANPITNLSNGALGYFSVSSSSTRDIIIPE